MCLFDLNIETVDLESALDAADNSLIEVSTLTILLEDF